MITRLKNLYALAGAAAIAFGAFGFNNRAAVARDGIQVSSDSRDNHSSWASAILCSALQHNTDGSWTTIKPIRVGSILLDHNTFQGTTETRIWDSKCVWKGGTKS